MNLIAHLESHLGPIQGGWSMWSDGSKVPFTVARMSESPIPGSGVLVTVGLSRHPRGIEGKEGYRQQELLMMYRLEDGPGNLPGILEEVALESIARGRAYDLGQVIGPRGPLRDGATVEALYVAMPAYFEDLQRPRGCRYDHRLRLAGSDHAC
jgi:hypothetical protein